MVDLFTDLTFAPDRVERDEEARLEQTFRRNRRAPDGAVHGDELRQGYRPLAPLPSRVLDAANPKNRRSHNLTRRDAAQ